MLILTSRLPMKCSPSIDLFASLSIENCKFENRPHIIKQLTIKEADNVGVILGNVISNGKGFVWEAYVLSCVWALMRVKAVKGERRLSRRLDKGGLEE